MAGNTQSHWNHCHGSRTLGALTYKVGPGFVYLLLTQRQLMTQNDFADKNILSEQAMKTLIEQGFNDKCYKVTYINL